MNIYKKISFSTYVESRMEISVFYFSTKHFVFSVKQTQEGILRIRHFSKYVLKYGKIWRTI